MCAITERPPGISRQLSGYALAVSRWLAAGAPSRTDRQVSELLAICQGCPKYDADRGACSKCGCKVNSSRWGLANKLRMATEACPDGHWKAEDKATSGKLRVGFVTPNLIVGGVESWLISLVRELGNLDSIAVSGVAHTGGPGLWAKMITDELGELCPVLSSAEIPGAVKLASPRQCVASLAAASDVLVVWSVTPDLLQVASGTQIVGVSHGCNDWWMASCAKLVDEWVAVSDAAAKPCPARSTVIPNGIDLDRCRSDLSKREARKRVGLSEDCLVAGYVGRLSDEKRVRNIAQAAYYLPDSWHVLICGTGREEIPSHPRVRVIEPTRSIGDIWRACDVGVVASSAEGYCLSLVEALACGVPCCSTDVGIATRLRWAVPMIGQPAEPEEIAMTIRSTRMLGLDPLVGEWINREASARAMGERWAKVLASLPARV